MNKKISFILVICILFMELTFPIGMVHAETYGIYTYTINNGEVMITDCDSSASGIIEIPDYIVECPVTSIGMSAFRRCSSLTSVTIPDSVKSVGDYAFSECIKLTSIIMPDSVTNIGICAFSDCSSLLSIIIPGSVASIGNSAFYGCSSLTSIIIPDSVTSIGDSAFYGCSSLTSIIIPDSVTSIGDSAFYGCSSLTSIVIPCSVASVGNYAFYGCSSLTSIIIPDSVTSIGDSAFYGCSSLSSITIPSSVTNIGICAFSDCSSLTSITIPERVTSISDWMFGGCRSLSRITMPGRIINVGDFAFYNCSSLAEITIPSSVTSIGGGAFSGCHSITSIIIPESVTSISYSAFSDCRSLTSIAIPESVTSVGWDAFSGCSSLTSITIPGSVESVGSGAFSDCSKLAEILVADNNENYCSQNGILFNKQKTVLIKCPEGYSKPICSIPDSVTSISSGAFSGCIGIMNIIIPNSVTSIGWSAFYDCSSLTQITIPDGVASIGDMTFYGCRNLAGVTIPKSVTSIGDDAFYQCSRLESITIPKSVANIGENAFRYCSSLKDLYYGGVQEDWNKINLGSKAIPTGTLIHYLICVDDIFLDNKSVNLMKGDKKLLTATITPEDATNKNIVWSSSNENIATVANGLVTAIGTGTSTITASTEDGICSASCTVMVCTDPSLFGFYNGKITGCYSSDKEVVIPDTIDNIPVTSIGVSAFSGCSSLTSITIPNSVTSIGDYAFAGCSGLTSITIPDSVTSIGERAFEDCSSLASITIPSSITSIGDYAFYNCSSLKSIAIPNSITSIGKYVFFGCGSLKIVVVPNSVTSIGDYAFSGCSGITNIIMSDSVTSIGESAFRGCSSLTSITIPDSVIYVGSNAFYNCSSLEGVYISNMAAWCSIYFKDICSNPLYYAKKLYLNNNLITDLVIPAGVTSVDGAFVGIDCLKSIRIPTSLQSIGNRDFASCMQLNAIYISDIAAWCSIDFHYSNPLMYAKKLYLNNELVTDLVIPESVLNINNNAFYGCDSITSVVISNSVTSIGSGAFQNCINLKNIKLGYRVEDINANAFLGCSSIEKITLDKNNTNYVLQDDVLYNSSKTQLILYPCGSDRTSFDIPNTVTKINSGVFKGCKNLKSLTIPGSITSIDNSTFSGCSGLVSVNILSGVTSIGEDAFSGCRNLTSITIPDSVTSIGNRSFSGCSSLEEVHISDIAAWCNISFKNNDSNPLSYAKNLYLNNELIMDLNIPDSVTSIGHYAFCDCSSLTSVTIPGSVTRIGSGAFSGCKSLTSITIPDSITNIGHYAFCDCSSLTSITIPDSGTSVNILSGDTSIGRYAFKNCSSLTDITIPGSITSIDYMAFDGCSSLTSLKIPASVTMIGGGVLYPTTILGYCAKLAEISVDEKNTAFSSQDGVLFNKSKTVLIKYPEGCLDAAYSIPDSVTSIDDYAFQYCSSLKSITIPDSITSIGKNAFEDCSSLDEVHVSDIAAWCNISFSSNPLSYAKKLYLDNEIIKDLTIPGSVTSIGKNPFSGCNSLTSVNILSGVTSIGDSAFSDCSNLTSVTIPDSVTSIGNGAFYNCGSLTSITIPNSITSIGNAAFSGCRKLSEILVDENNANYCSQDGVLFNKAKTLLINYPGGCLDTIYSIPDSVTYINDFAFEDCSNLTSVAIPNSVTGIGRNVFQYCSRLTSITIPDSVTKIGGDAFWGSSLSDVYYSGSESEREKINISTGNDQLLNATWHYESSDPTNISVIKAADISAKPGTSVKVDIMLENNPGTAIIGFNIGYDGNAMTLASVTNGEIFDDADILNGNIQKNPYMFTCMNSTENKNGDGVLISLTFNISENCPVGDYAINISGCEAYSIDENAIDFKTINSKVTVSDGTGAGIDISVSIPNYEKGGTVMAGLYDKSGKLLSVQSYAPAESINVSFEQSGAYIKVMHWNMDNMIPLSPVKLVIPADVPNYQKGGTVMTGLYDKSGKLLSVKSYTPAKSINVSFEQSGAYVKVMQWDMNTMMPLTKSQTIYIN